MRDYTLKDKLHGAAQAPPPAVSAALRSETLALRRADIEAYRPVPSTISGAHFAQATVLAAGDG